MWASTWLEQKGGGGGYQQGFNNQHNTGQLQVRGLCWWLTFILQSPDTRPSPLPSICEGSHFLWIICDIYRIASNSSAFFFDGVIKLKKYSQEGFMDIEPLQILILFHQNGSFAVFGNSKNAESRLFLWVVVQKLKLWEKHSSFFVESAALCLPTLICCLIRAQSKLKRWTHKTSNYQYMWHSGSELLLCTLWSAAISR